MIKLQWKPLTQTAKAPAKAHQQDAAYDLFADLPNGPTTLLKGQTAIIATGVSIMPPEGWSCDIRGRSGMSSKGKIVALGLVDAFYTGPWGVILYNGTDRDIDVNHHDKVAQFTLNRVYESELELVEKFDIPVNARGTLGFGSSGHK
jgi:dUTP pyrophosphatase